MVTLEENKEIARRAYHGRLDELVERMPDLAAEDVLLHDPMVGEVRGHGELAEYYRGISEGMADARLDVDVLVAEGDEVTVRWNFSGVHEGPVPGLDVEPTGEEVSFSGIDILRIEDGAIAECWSQFDSLGLMRQIGAVPADDNLSEAT